MLNKKRFVLSVLAFSIGAPLLLAFQNFSYSEQTSGVVGGNCFGGENQFDCRIRVYKEVRARIESQMPSLNLSIVAQDRDKRVKAGIGEIILTGSLGNGSAVVNGNIYHLNRSISTSSLPYSAVYYPIFSGPLPSAFDYVDYYTGEVVQSDTDRKIVRYTGSYFSTRDHKLYGDEGRRLIGENLNPHTLLYDSIADYSGNIYRITWSAAENGGVLVPIYKVPAELENPVLVRGGTNQTRVCSINSNNDFYCTGGFGSVYEICPLCSGNKKEVFSNVDNRTTAVLVAKNICAQGIITSVKDGEDYLLMTCDGLFLKEGQLRTVIKNQGAQAVHTSSFFTPAAAYSGGFSLAPLSNTPPIPNLPKLPSRDISPIIDMVLSE